MMAPTHSWQRHSMTSRGGSRNSAITALVTAPRAGGLCFVIREDGDRGWLVPAPA
jgi:hypothetical protein